LFFFFLLVLNLLYGIFLLPVLELHINVLASKLCTIYGRLFVYPALLDNNERTNEYNYKNECDK